MGLPRRRWQVIVTLSVVVSEAMHLLISVVDNCCLSSQDCLVWAHEIVRVHIQMRALSSTFSPCCRLETSPRPHVLHELLRCPRRYYHGSGLSGRVAGNGPSGVATFGAGDTVGVGAILLPDPAYPVIALFFTLNGSPLGPEGGEPLAQPWAE